MCPYAKQQKWFRARLTHPYRWRNVAVICERDALRHLGYTFTASTLNPVKEPVRACNCIFSCQCSDDAILRAVMSHDKRPGSCRFRRDLLCFHSSEPS